MQWNEAGRRIILARAAEAVVAALRCKAMSTETTAKAYTGRDGIPWYATAEDFKTVWDENTTFPFYEDEDASGVYGFGHQSKTAFAALVNEYDQLCGCDVPPEDKYTAADVTHCWAVLLEPRNLEGMQFSWRGVDSMTLGSWPLTRVSR